MSATQDRKTKVPPEPPGRESGQPGGGQGRIDKVGHSGVYPGSGPYPSGEAEVRTPESFVQGQRDAEGREVEGGPSSPWSTGIPYSAARHRPPAVSPGRANHPRARRTDEEKSHATDTDHHGGGQTEDGRG
jgi:hypothetical protein